MTKSMKNVSENPDESTQLWPWMEAYSRWAYEKPWWPILITVGICLALYSWLFASYGIRAYANTNYYRWAGDDISDRWDSYVGAADVTYTSLYDMLGRSIPMFIVFPNWSKNMDQLVSVGFKKIVVPAAAGAPPRTPSATPFL